MVYSAKPLIRRDIDRMLRRLFSLLVLSLVVSVQVVNAAQPYQLQPGDVLNVSVWGEPELSLQTTVLPDGSVSFPLVGSIDANALDVTTLEGRMETALNDYIPAPDVSVSVVDAAGNRIFVVGGVAAPGAFQMSSSITVIQAIALAGGLTTFADDGGIRVLREVNGEQTTLEVEYSRIMAGKELDTNFQLLAGDTVMVPK